MFGSYVSRDSVGNTSACIQFSIMYPKTVIAFAVILLVAVTAGPIKETAVYDRKQFKNYLSISIDWVIKVSTIFSSK